MELLQRAKELAEDISALRRDFHRHPELGFQEHRTARIVARHLEGWGLPVRTGVGITGVVGEIRNGAGPTVALRADMDALPIQEEAEHDYASTIPGVMHACGHDAHMAALLGAVRLLTQDQARGNLPAGTIRLLFQPSEERMDEEGKGGALRMVENGAMDGVSAVLGLHVGAHLPAGKVFLKEGPLMAGSDDLHVVVRGRSAHAALPHEGVDALVLAAQGIMGAQQAVSRRLSPMENGVVTFGRIQGGVAANVLPGEVTLEGTVRYFVEDVRRRLHESVTGAFKGLEAQGGRVEVGIRPGCPPVVNDGHVTEVARGVARTVVGEADVWDAEPMMGAEDFAVLAREAPGAFLWLGAALPDAREHHHPRFDIDESVLPVASALLAGSATALLAGFPPEPHD
jgi:IAA-amino acid hydrolase